MAEHPHGHVLSGEVSRVTSMGGLLVKHMLVEDSRGEGHDSLTTVAEENSHDIVCDAVGSDNRT